MKLHNSNVLLVTSVITVLAVGIYTTANYLFPTTDDGSSALTYGSNTDVSFTINPRLSISTSTDSLTIDNLVPGTTNDSNTVSVTVSSNTPYGYVLSAGVGSTVSTDPYYNTSDLVHDNSTTQVPTTNKFSSIATSASLQTLDTDNTWGYSTSTDGGTSWSTYSGLSHTETKPLLDISDPATPSTIDFKIAARSANTQASGTYNNVITFYVVGKPEPHYLYEEVAKMSKGAQSAEDLQAEITSPTSRDYREDTSNSGVYEYNGSVFGESSDASNANKIYYYRGILEPEEDQGQYGSDGQATTYPNYVRLDNDTCWRIVRTTGSGGVKMIYNGTWTDGTCANAKSNAEIGKSTFNGTTYTQHQAVLVGYTYDNTYANNSVVNRPLATLFGTNTSDNNTFNSSIKWFIDNWFRNNLDTYTDILEPSAGYCGDRTVYYDDILQPESFEIPQYSTDTFGFFFGATARVSAPTLTCAKGNKGTITVDRSRVDLYTVIGTPTGNGRLDVPIALFTMDEAIFVGSGWHTDGSASDGPVCHKKSFLNSGSGMATLSPDGRGGQGDMGIIPINGAGCISHAYIWNTLEVRPAISLKSASEYISGSGTAADPWVVTAP